VCARSRRLRWGISVDQYGRLLRYVRVKDGLNVNVRLVRVGAAAPYFYDESEGPVREPARTARPTRAGEEAGLVGTVPAHSLRPEQGGQHPALSQTGQQPCLRSTGRLTRKRATSSCSVALTHH
jgi:hypothetical protein